MPDRDGPRIDETLVARLWDSQHPFRLPLRTTDGAEIDVVYRGRRRFDRGPDFPGAIVVFPGEQAISGDVEIHVRSSDWRRHGHHLDSAYSNVVLHVVLWNDTRSPCLKSDGTAVPVLELAPHLLEQVEKLAMANPSETPRPSPCLPGSATSPDLAGVLEACGMARFDEKVKRNAGDLAYMPAEEALYRGIADVLGYSQNREPFRQLAELLPLQSLLEFSHSSVYGPDPLSMEALLLGAAGLLPGQRGVEPVGSYVTVLEAIWEKDGLAWAGTSMNLASWQFFRVRPVNFPTRRVAFLASVVQNWPEGGLEELLGKIVRTAKPRQVSHSIERLLLDLYGEGYWMAHSDFGQPLPRPARPVGRARAAEVAVNLFLPFLAARAEARGDGALASASRAAYRSYPKRGDNEFTRYMGVQITGASRPPVSRSACRQQGLLHIFRRWCEVKNCGECPVASLGAHLSDCHPGEVIGVILPGPE